MSPIEQGIKAKIEKKGTPLKEWELNIYRGILTGFNEAFIIDRKTKEELIAQDPKSAEIIRPILRGRDIKKYSYEFADLYIITTFPSLKIDIEMYPAVKEHLLLFGHDRLKQTGEHGSRKKTNNKWFETQDSISYLEDFSKQKIVWLCISDKSVFAVDEDNVLCNNAVYFISTEHSKYLCSVMNTKLIEWYFNSYATGTGVGTNKWEKFVVELIPIPQLSLNEQKPFISAIDKIKEFKKTNISTVELEKDLSNRVYSLYGLTKEEIDFIDSQ